MVTAAAAVVLQAGEPPPVGPDELFDYGPVLIRAGWFLVGLLLVLVVGWLIVEPLVSRGIRRRNPDNQTVQEAITRYLRLIAVVIGLLVGAGMAGYGQILADSALVVAAATLAFGVAGQQVIASLVSGLVLVVDPEFNVGDHIVWEDGEGTVRSITLRVTRVRTPDGELVTLPNTVLTEQAIIRRFGREHYRIVDRIGLAFEDDVDEAMDHLHAVAAEIDGILTEPAPAVYVDEFGDDAVELRVIYWVANPTHADVARIRSAYAMATKDRLETAEMTISPASEHELSGRLAVEGAA